MNLKHLRIGRRRRKSPRPTWAAQPTLFHGISSQALQQAIADLQAQLQQRGYAVSPSGHFDDETATAVRQFQQRQGLRVDGVVGAMTWAALHFATLSRQRDAATPDPAMVQTLQNLLRAEGLLDGASGRFDRATERALKRFQRGHGLLADGVCGPMTWSVLTGQRPAPSRHWRQRRWWDGLLLEQLLIVAAIQVGIHSNPLDMEQELSFLRTLIISYSLTWVAPLIFEHCSSRVAGLERFPLFKYAPYVLVGFFWRPIIVHTLRLTRTALTR